MCVVENTRCEAFPSAAQGSPSPGTGIARERRFVSAGTHTIRKKRHRRRDEATVLAMRGRHDRVIDRWQDCGVRDKHHDVPCTHRLE